MINLFSSWSKKDEAAIDPSLLSDRRRAVRIPSPENIAVSVILKKRAGPLSPKVADMSTLGIGLSMDFIPEENETLFTFQSPTLLKGLQILGQKKHIKRTIDPTSSQGFHIGYEFVFSSSYQQDQLLRWLTRYLQKQKIYKQNSIPFPQSNFINSIRVKDIHVSFPLDKNQYESSVGLIAPLSIHHGLIQTKFFMGMHKKKTLVTVPLIPDTLAFGLSAEKVFPEKIASMRAQGLKLGEITTGFFKEDLLPRNPVMAPLQKLTLLYCVFPYILTYARDFAQLSHIVALVPMHLDEFYRVWLFNDVDNLGNVTEKKNSEIRDFQRFMVLDLLSLEDRLNKERPELVAPLRYAMSQLRTFEKSYFPDSTIFGKWFRERNGLLSSLTTSQLNYFKSLVPDVFSVR